MELQNHPDCREFIEAGRMTQLAAWYEEPRKTIWMMLKGEHRPSFTLTMLGEIAQLAAAVKASGVKVDFWVTGSLMPQIYNAGGDLAYFAQHIRAKDHAALQHYAHACVDAVYAAMTGFGVDATTIAMVEGSALGGGFECALAHQYLVAQYDAKMGFPEIAFNLFPGMGAYSFVARRAGPKLADDLIASGESHTADWYHQRHLVERVCQPGQAYRTVRTLIDELTPKRNGIAAMQRTKNRVLGPSKQELLDITDDWARAAFCIDEKDLAYMERLVMLQDRRMAKPSVLRVA